MNMEKRNIHIAALLFGLFIIALLTYSSHSLPSPRSRSISALFTDPKDLIYEAAYKDLDFDVYRSSLLKFVEDAFPPSHRASTIDTLNTLLKEPTASYDENRPLTAVPATPRHIYQKSKAEEPNKSDWNVRTWLQRNPEWEYQHFNDEQMDTWTSTTFKSADGFPTAILKAYETMQVKIMRVDFWRYLILAIQGGVYSDFDTVCLKPIEQWHWDPYNSSSVPDSEPAIVVGIETDVGTIEGWHLWWPRPIQISQWTLKSIPGHPVMVDVARRITEDVNSRNGKIVVDDNHTSPAGRRIDTTLEMTGPGVFTDSVIHYLMVKYNVKWRDLRNLETPRRFDDILVLPITGFSPGVGHMGSKDVTDPAACVQHLFAGSWKTDTVV